jgi:O-antigen/teichoic acid export membrane protein
MNIGKRNIITNTSSRIIFVSVGKLLNFVSIPIITHSLGTSGYGTYVLLMTIGTYASLLANWGFFAKGIREVANPKNDPETIVSNLFSSRLILWMIGAILTIVISSIVYRSLNWFILITLAILSTLSTALQIDYYYYGKKQAFYPSLYSLISQILFVALVFLFIKGENSLYKLLIISIIYPLLNIMLLYIRYLRTNKLKIDFSVKKSLMLLKENFSLGLGAKLSFFQNSIPIFLIPMILGKAILGQYAAAYKIYALYVVVLSTINLVLSPWVVEYRVHDPLKQKQLFYKLLLGYFIIAITAIITILLTYKTVIPWLLGEKFALSGEILAIMALFIIPSTTLYNLMSMYMNNYNMDKYYLYGATMQILLTVTLIPLGLYFFKLKGAIWGMSISQLSISLYYGSKIYKIFINTNRNENCLSTSLSQG